MAERRPHIHHILNTSSNLLGFCLLIITSLKISGKSAQTLVDEILMGSLVLFMTSCLLSFLSMRSHKPKSITLMEHLAEYAFVTGLVSLFVVVLIIAFTKEIFLS